MSSLANLFYFVNYSKERMAREPLLGTNNGSEKPTVHRM